MKKTNVFTAFICSLPLSAGIFAQPSDTSGRTFVADTPDAIVCVYANTQSTRYMYYKTAGVEGDAVRYDGPNNNLLHYSLPGGQLFLGFNPQPAIADCASQQFSLQDLNCNGSCIQTTTTDACLG